MTLETMLRTDTEYELILFTVLERLLTPPDWDPVVRILSAYPVELGIETLPQIPAGIKSQHFEEALAGSLELEQTIQVIPGIVLCIHSSTSMAAFVLSYDQASPCDVHVVTSTRSRNFATTGRWRHSIPPAACGRVVLGVITQKKTQFSSPNARLSGYEFEVELSQYTGKKIHMPASSTATSRSVSKSDVIELD
jgi:hypothetical protein